jgi:hypothetical protein
MLIMSLGTYVLKCEIVKFANVLRELIKVVILKLYINAFVLFKMQHCFMSHVLVNHYIIAVQNVSGSILSSQIC